jgi:hypothetical protein
MSDPRRLIDAPKVLSSAEPRIRHDSALARNDGSPARQLDVCFAKKRESTGVWKGTRGVSVSNHRAETNLDFEELGFPWDLAIMSIGCGRLACLAGTASEVGVRSLTLEGHLQSCLRSSPRTWAS